MEGSEVLEMFRNGGDVQEEKTEDRDRRQKTGLFSLVIKSAASHITLHLLTLPSKSGNKDISHVSHRSSTLILDKIHSNPPLIIILHTIKHKSRIIEARIKARNLSPNPANPPPESTITHTPTTPNLVSLPACRTWSHYLPRYAVSYSS